MNIGIELNSLLRACEDQSALDFKAMRAQNADAADVAYEDWVFLADNILDVDNMILEYAADMKHALRTIVGKYEIKNVGTKILNMDLVPQKNDADKYNIPNMVQQYLVCKVLTWWYVYRNADIAALYEKKATSALEKIFWECTPVIGTIQPRYF